MSFSFVNSDYVLSIAAHESALKRIDNTRAGQVVGNRFSRPLVTAFYALLLSFPGSSISLASTDREIIRGFNLTVFGAEYAPFGIQSRYIRKFRGPVRFYVENLAKRNRSKEVRNFILSLNNQISGLKTQLVSSQSRSNFNVYVVDRKDYVDTVRKRVYRRPNASAPGKCLVRSVFSRHGIIRSDAVIVSDGGNRLFKRCMVEEILQGLGPLNEHPSLFKSVFNDRSRQTTFTRFDRHILNMLYDSRVKIGASIENVQPVLPSVLRDVKRRIR